MQPMSIREGAGPSSSSGGGPPSAVSYAYAQVHGLNGQGSMDERKSRRRLIALGLLIAFFFFVSLLVWPSALRKSAGSSSSPSPASTMDTEDGLDPDEFEKELDEAVEEDNELEKGETQKDKPKDTEQKKTSSEQASDDTTAGDDDDILESEEDEQAPKQCHSRATDRPGMKGGARIHFLHIPKSGGTSVEHAMRGWGRGRVYRNYRVNNDGSNAKCPPGAVSNMLLAGHRGYGYCDDIKHIPEKYFIFTVLREPVSRVVSLYDMNVKLQHDVTYTSVFGNKPLMTLIKEYNRTKGVEPGEALLKYMASQQVRYLCGYECFLPKNRTMNRPDVMLAKALENLRKVDVLGVTAKMNDMIDQLKLHLRWLPVGFKSWPHANEGKVAKSKMDEQARQILAEWSKEDIVLYKEVERLAEEKTKLARSCLQQMDEAAQQKSGNPVEEESQEETSKEQEQAGVEDEGPDLSPEETQAIEDAAKTEQGEGEVNDESTEGAGDVRADEQEEGDTRR